MAVPGATPVTFPVLSTVRIAVFEDSHSNEEAADPTGSVFAVNLILSNAFTVSSPVKVTPVIGSAVTVMVAVSSLGFPPQ